MSRPTPEQLQQWSALFPSIDKLCEDGWDAEEVDDYGARLWEYLSESFGIPQNLIRQLWTVRYLLWLWDSEREWTAGAFDREKCVQSVWDIPHLQVYHQIEAERKAE